MKVKKFVMGPVANNCYLVWEEATGEALVIDPGPNPGRIAREARAKGLRLVAIVQTHDHWDHSAGSLILQRLTGAPLFRHPADPAAGWLHRPRPADGKKTLDLADGQELRLGTTAITVLHTPGHSPGSVSLSTPGLLFSGDLLFSGSVGRWDLKGGNFRQLLRSLQQRIAALPDNVRVLPGHGPATVLGEERRSNPYFFAQAQKPPAPAAE
jgi:glyoxylase-like metal-dependent hydrolase (beta-lactamase superfamily II)